jgi:hypothetical protein
VNILNELYLTRNKETLKTYFDVIFGPKKPRGFEFAYDIERPSLQWRKMVVKLNEYLANEEKPKPPVIITDNKKYGGKLHIGLQRDSFTIYTYTSDPLSESSIDVTFFFLTLSGDIFDFQTE